jgi:hypothetical protein
VTYHRHCDRREGHRVPSPQATPSLQRGDRGYDEDSDLGKLNGSGRIGRWSVPSYEILGQKCMNRFEVTMTISERRKRRSSAPNARAQRWCHSSAVSWRRHRRRADGEAPPTHRMTLCSPPLDLLLCSDVSLVAAQMPDSRQLQFPLRVVHTRRDRMRRVALFCAVLLLPTTVLAQLMKCRKPDGSLYVGSSPPADCGPVSDVRERGPADLPVPTKTSRHMPTPASTPMIDREKAP